MVRSTKISFYMIYKLVHLRNLGGWRGAQFYSSLQFKYLLEIQRRLFSHLQSTRQKRSNILPGFLCLGFPKCVLPFSYLRTWRKYWEIFISNSVYLNSKYWLSPLIFLDFSETKIKDDINNYRYFPNSIFPSSNFLEVFSKVAISQLCNFPISNFPAAALGPLAHPSRSARPHCKAQPNLWKVVTCEIAHLGRCHLGNCRMRNRPWVNIFG